MVYLDDMIIYNSDWGCHLKHTELVIGEIAKADLIVNPQMCIGQF